MAKFTIHDLEKRVKQRAKAKAGTSYTRVLLNKGVAQCAKKFGEEAVETVLAAVNEKPQRVKEEAADVLYHLIVLLQSRGVSLADVEKVLAGRTAKSGLEEKASRTRR